MPETPVRMMIYKVHTLSNEQIVNAFPMLATKSNTVFTDLAVDVSWTIKWQLMTSYPLPPSCCLHETFPSRQAA